MGLIEQLEYLIYDSEVYFCVQNFAMPESLFEWMKNGGFETSFEKFNRISNQKRSFDIKI